jgi:hypothetical protein
MKVLTDEQLTLMQQHADQPIPPFAPHPDRHYRAVDTYLESWPNDLRSLSVAQIDIPLTLEECTILGSQIADFGQSFAPEPLPAHDLIAKVQTASEKMPGPFFVRLGSRSPKDALYWFKDEMKVDNGEEALQLLTASSERVWEDLRIGLHFGYASHIFLRQWTEMPEWSEFRCFMKGRKLIAVSQYYYRQAHRELIEDYDGIKWAIEQFFTRQFKHLSHLDDVVFDVFVKQKTNAGTFNSGVCGVPPWRAWEIKLLEINPYWNLCDPCLFNWSELDALAEGGTEYQFRFIEQTEQLIGHKYSVVKADQL